MYRSEFEMQTGLRMSDDFFETEVKPLYNEWKAKLKIAQPTYMTKAEFAEKWMKEWKEKHNSENVETH